LVKSKKIGVKEVKSVYDDSKLGKGEKSVIDFCLSVGVELVVSDDEAFLKFLDGLSIPYTPVAGTILMLVTHMRLTKEEGINYLCSLKDMVKDEHLFFDDLIRSYTLQLIKPEKFSHNKEIIDAISSSQKQNNILIEAVNIHENTLKIIKSLETLFKDLRKTKIYTAEQLKIAERKLNKLKASYSYFKKDKEAFNLYYELSDKDTVLVIKKILLTFTKPFYKYRFYFSIVLFQVTRFV